MKKNKKKFIKPIRKRCFFDENKIEYIDYKNVELLNNFITKSGKIIPRKITATTKYNQKRLSVAIKNARIAGLMPFIKND